jgi:hypothetical protein
MRVPAAARHLRIRDRVAGQPAAAISNPARQYRAGEVTVGPDLAALDGPLVFEPVGKARVCTADRADPTDDATYRERGNSERTRALLGHASSAAYGRNIMQDTMPTPITRALMAVVHKNAPAEPALAVPAKQELL